MPRLTGPAHDALQESKELLGKQPFIIPHALASWPASSWGFSDLLQVSGEVSVPVEASFNGGDYRDFLSEFLSDSARGFQPDVLVPLRVLIEHIQDLEAEASPPSGSRKELRLAGQRPRGKEPAKEVRGETVMPGGQASTTGSVENGDTSTLGVGASSGRELPDVNEAKVLLYLAQQDIQQVLPHVAEGLRKPLSPEVAERLHKTSIWLGPRGTVTPLHCDPYHNLFCQLIGQKHIRIYDPSTAGDLDLFARPVVLRNTSRVRDVDTLKASYQECMLQPGEVLHIPRKWFHYVRALEGSMSVSFWWT